MPKDQSLRVDKQLKQSLRVARYSTLHPWVQGRISIFEVELSLETIK